MRSFPSLPLPWLLLSLLAAHEHQGVQGFVFWTTTTTTTTSTTSKRTTRMKTRRPSLAVFPLQSSTTSTTQAAQTKRTTAIADKKTHQSSSKQQSSSNNNNNNNIQLTFAIDLVHQSDPLPFCSTTDDEEETIRLLARAWEQDVVRNGLITPNPAAVQEFPLASAQLDDLQHYHRQMFESTTCNNDDIDDNDHDDTNDDIDDHAQSTARGLRFTTGAVQFPGLTVDSTVTVAVLRRNNNNNSNNRSQDDDDNEDCTSICAAPYYYEYHVLDTVNTATGRRPMVWLFNQILQRAPPVSRSMTTASLVRRKQQDGAVVIRYHSRATVTCPISRSLLRFLPASQRQTEAWGAAALQQAVLAEVQACIQTVRPYLLSRKNK